MDKVYRGRGNSEDDRERKDIEQELELIHQEFETANTWFHEITDVGRELVAVLNRIFPAAKSLTVKIGGKMGNTVLAVGKTAQATAHEWSGLAGAGVELPLAGAISWVSADPSVCTVDAASGLITAVAPSKLDPNGAPIPVDITGTDAANNLSNPPGDATITDSPLVAQSLTVTVAPL